MKKIRKWLIFIIVLFIIFVPFKVWYNSLKADLQDVADSAKDLYSSEDAKQTVEKVKEDAPSKIVDFIKKGSKVLEDGGKVVADYLTGEADTESTEDTSTENTEESTTEEIVEDVVTSVLGVEESKEDAITTKDGIILEEVELWSVVDGDTLTVITDENTSEKVRLIGVNTPESVHSNKELNTVYGKYASEWLNDYATTNMYLYGTPIYLEYDVSDTDIYGRTLAYVWLSNDVDTTNEEDIRNYMLNSVLVLNGYAEDVVYEPNVKYKDYFATFYEEAKASNQGLWQYDDFNLFD